MSAEHFFPMFFGDFLASTITWTGPERGLYMQLLLTQWTSGPLPTDLDRLARAVNYQPEEFRALWPVVMVKFETIEGRFSNSRVEGIRTKNAEIRAARVTQAKLAADARWHAKSNAVSNANGNADSNAPRMPSISIPITRIEPKRGEARASARPAHGSRIPEDFGLTPERESYAKKENLDPTRTLEKFVDHWRAASGANSRKRDWDAAWRNWCRREAEFSRGPVGVKGEAIGDAILRLKRQADEAGEPEL